jgi:predicted molibdopterin-dependent oxidoreductase YjgC
MVRQYLLDGKAKPAHYDPKSTDWGWVETDWEKALDITAQKLGQTIDAHGPNSVGVFSSAKCTNEENYLMNKFARQVIGTNNIDHCARL